MRTKAEVQDARPDLLDDLPHEAEFDALTDLFLDDQPIDAPPARTHAPPAASASGSAVSAAPPAVAVEALIMGHLPTLAGAWAAEYARHAFRASGRPVALLRDAAEGRTLETLPREPARTGPDSGAPMDRALAQCAGLCRVIVRADETDEPDLIAASGEHDVTILTGADDAAIVSAYRTIKRLFVGAGERERPIGVAVMGADEPRAREAFERLRRAAEAFLGLRLTLGAVCPRLSPEPFTLRWSGPRSGRDYPALLGSLRAVRPEPAPSPIGKQRAPQSPHRSPAPSAESWEFDDLLAMDDGPLAAPAADVQAARTLVRGVHAADLRCPVAPDVELGVDDAGRLHLVADDRSERPMEGLSAACEWATENFETLALAVRARGLPTPRDAHRPLLHALTRSSDRAKRMLRCGVRVHLIAEVMVDGRVTTACVDLD